MSKNSTPHTSKKVLIVDDEEGIRESLKLILEDHFDLLLAGDGDQCREIMKNSKDDIGVILMDIKMPNTNGLDLLKEIKENDPHQKVVIITGYKSVETATEAVRLGASGYIVKPFKTEEILSTVRKNV